MLTPRPRQEQQRRMVESLDYSLLKVRPHVFWGGSGATAAGNEPRATAPPVQPVQARKEPKFTDDVIATLLALGLKRKRAEELEKNAKGSTAGEQVADCLRRN